MYVLKYRVDPFRGQRERFVEISRVLRVHSNAYYIRRRGHRARRPTVCYAAVHTKF